MEKRIGAAIILIEKKGVIDTMNSIISDHSEMIVARQGVPMREKGINVITLVFEGSTDLINSLTGKLGRLEGVQVKTALTR